MMGRKKRGPETVNLPGGIKRGTLHIAPCIMIQKGGRYRIWVSEATMKGLLEVQCQLVLNSYDEALSVLLASYKEVLDRRHKIETEKQNNWRQNRIMTNKKATSDRVAKREPQPYETYRIVKEEDLEDTSIVLNPLQEDKSEDHSVAESKSTYQKSEKLGGTQESFLEQDHLEGGWTGEGRSTVLSAHDQQEEGLDDSMKEEGLDDDWSCEDHEDHDDCDGDENYEKGVYGSEEGDSRTSTFLTRKEPEDNGSSGDERSELHETPSCSQQGGNSSIQTSYGTKETNQDISDGTPHDRSHREHVPEEWILHGAQENYPDTSATVSCSSEHDSALLPDQVDYAQGQSYADSATISDHNDRRLDGEIVMGCGVKGEISGERSHDKSHAQGLSSDDSATVSDHDEGKLDVNPGNEIGPSEECRTTLSNIEGSFLCSVSNEELTSGDDPTEHFKLHGGVRTHRCTSCNKKFVTVKDLNRHMRVHTGERPHKCSVCGRRFREGYHLKEHMTVHSEQKRYQCSYCERTFVWRNSLYTHMRKHLGEKPYQCKYCDMRFTHRIMLSEHTRSHHSSKEKTFECSICHRKFARSADLIGHGRVHTGEKPFQCSQCGKTFSYKRVLVVHEKTHTGEKPHLCPICGRAFGRDYILQQHMLIHSGDLPFPCSVCSRSFRQKCTLVKHMKSQHPTLAT